MTTSEFEIIATFADGERVDPTALEEALASAEGRAYLSDLLALREVIRLPDVAAPALVPIASSRWRWLAAAAMVAIGVASGYMAGASVERARSVAVAAASTAAPTPTRVIELQLGTNGRDSGGGH